MRKILNIFLIAVTALIALSLASCHDDKLVASDEPEPGPNDFVYFRMRTDWKSGRSPMHTRSLDNFYTSLPSGSSASASGTFFPLRLYPQNLQVELEDEGRVSGQPGKPATMFIGKTTDVNPTSARRIHRSAKVPARATDEQKGTSIGYIFQVDATAADGSGTYVDVYIQDLFEYVTGQSGEFIMWREKDSNVTVFADNAGQTPIQVAWVSGDVFSITSPNPADPNRPTVRYVSSMGAETTNPDDSPITDNPDNPNNPDNPDNPQVPDEPYETEYGTVIPMENATPVFIPKDENSVPDNSQPVAADDYDNQMFYNAADGQLEYHDYPKYGAADSDKPIKYVAGSEERPIFNTDLTSDGEVPTVEGYINPYHDMPYDPAGNSIPYNPTQWDDFRPIEDIPDVYPDENDQPGGYADYHDTNGGEGSLYRRSEMQQMDQVEAYWPWGGDGAWTYESLPTFSTHDNTYDCIPQQYIPNRMKSKHFVFNMKHANAILRIWFAVDRNYNKVRKIVLRDVKIAVGGGEPVAAFTNNVSYPVDRRYGFVVPVAAESGYGNHEVYSVTFFKPEKRVVATADRDDIQTLEDSPNEGEPSITRDTPLTFTCEYDIYDNDLPYTRPYATEYDQDGNVVKQGMTYERKTSLALDNHTHLVRRGVTVKNSFTFGQLGAGITDANLTGGHYYDLYLTINPEYLYILSEHDNKHLTVE